MISKYIRLIWERGLLMECIQLMIDEHKNIKRMLAVIRKLCYKVLEQQNVDYEDFLRVIDFVRNYADRHHHGKEETLLFNRMNEELGPRAEMLVRHGMLVEHDLGRLHIQELESAVQKVLEGDKEARLDVIANAVSYTHLLNRHIDKEDAVVFKYASNNLSKATLNRLDDECSRFERNAQDKSIQKKYLDLLSQMESRIL
jgi:hemerythrin-like domain-containing protein